VDGGKTWARVTLPASTTFIHDNYESLQGACQVIGKTIWFMAADGILFRSRDKGEHWEMFSTPIDTTGIMLNLTRTLAFADTLNGLALLATYNWATHVNSNQFFRTSDGGATWTEFAPNGPMPQFTSIIPVPGTAQTFVGQGKEIHVSAVSTDFGQSWTTIDDRHGYSCTAFLSPTIGWSSMFNGNQFYDSITPVMFKWQGDFTLVNTDGQPDPAPCMLYPNPFTDRVYLQCPAAVDQYRVYTVAGSLVRSGEIGAEEASIDLSALSPDISLLELWEHNGRRTTEKLVRGY
jgi:hypothetical protein